MKKLLLAVISLSMGTPVLASPPRPKALRPPPCQGSSLERSGTHQGTLLWGTKEEVKLVSVSLSGARLRGKELSPLRLEEGRLMTTTSAREFVGAVLQGKTLDGTSLEVALCGAEPDARDSSVERYRLEVWRATSQTWEDPCIATGGRVTGRALAVSGVWNASGASGAVEGQFTFACEAGTIAKCVDWGYKPWSEKDGQSLTALHQACTRMARADYCGNGKSHTSDGVLIDVYDDYKVMTRMTESGGGWDVSRGAFEAAWNPEGATCLSHLRDGKAVETVMQECPGRFQWAEKDLGGDDRCTVIRKDANVESASLRNRSYARR
jgi:hypothetical protein